MIRTAWASWTMLLTHLHLSAAQPATAWMDYELPWRLNAGDVPWLDLSFLHRRPAGADGFVRIQEGHFVEADGTRWRIWGVNLTGGACFPRPEDAAAVADYLDRWGINCVRFHFLDSNWGPEKTLFEWGTDTTRRLDAGQLARLDRFVAELQRRGIYSNFNLNVGRNFRAGDGVADWQHLGLAKAATLFDPRMIELQREFAQQLLTHVNPHTQRAYREEPALAIVELVNENSLVEAWFSGRLVGRDPGPADATWAGITHHYARELDGTYQAWLARHLSAEQRQRIAAAAGVTPGNPIPRLRPEEFDQAEAFRFATEARFYLHLETTFFTGMQHYLKDSLGTRALVAATSDHNHYRTGYPLLTSAAKLDFVDGHVYWQHPTYTRDPATGRRGFALPNTPMVSDPGFSTPVRLSRSAVTGKPFTVSETNHPFPHEYACEGIPILAAYALFQDWDGFFFYTLEHEAPDRWATRTPGHFDLAPDPVKMVNLAVCGLMFQRDDVAPARHTVARSYSEEQVIESLRLPSRERPFFTPGFSPLTPLIHGTRIAALASEPSHYEPLVTGDILVSDTAQLEWHRQPERGCVTVRTERTEIVAGFLPERLTLKHLSFEPENRFGALVLSSLDDQPIAHARRLILAATSRSQLTGMAWNEQRTTLTDWGRRPMQIEPVRGQAVLRGLRQSNGLTVRPLDGAGRVMPDSRPAKAVADGWQIALDQPTVWYALELTP